jgi:hypothetical protein
VEKKRAKISSSSVNYNESFNSEKNWKPLEILNRRWTEKTPNNGREINGGNPGNK